MLFVYVHNIRKIGLCNGSNTNVGTDAFRTILATMIIYFNANFKCYAVRVFNFIYSISGLTTPRRFLCTAGVLLLFPAWSTIAAFCQIPECQTVCHRIVINRGNALLFHVLPLLSFRSHLFSKLISSTELLLSDEKLIAGYS